MSTTTESTFRHFDVGDRIRTRYQRKIGKIVEVMPCDNDHGMSANLLLETDAGDQYVVHEYLAILID